ncbi:MAG: amino acid adenylation domain-containing protein, partial [Dinghuibacter sp.]|nr:amino acid adenylation domain-containing protein [Dinghuibacter sp.]
GKLLTQADSRGVHARIPIGRPFSATSVYVADKQLNLCPVGIPGELLIGGRGVSLGYLNKPELTSRQFIVRNYSGSEERLYRTGDLVRMLPDGQIEFLGRIDNQVKIRGHRIEPGDVETALLAIEGIEQVLVVARECSPGNKELVAYYTGTLTEKNKDLRTQIEGRLPVYMLPGYFIHLTAFPLTPNGKINRKALPDPEQSIQPGTTQIVESRNKEEQALVEVWASVLKRKEISVHANFFELGGDSIKGILIVSRLKQKGFELKIADLMQTPVLSALAGKLAPLNREVKQSVVSGSVLLTPVQQAFLYSAIYANKAHYNQSVALESNVRIEQALLEKSLEQLVKHHDALRMVFKNENGNWRQENKGVTHKAFSLFSYDLTGSGNALEEMGTACEQLQAGIQLEQGPLVKAALFKLPQKDYVVLIIHHLVVDGVSWRIILEDLQTIYSHLEKKRTANLPRKTDSFQRWAKLLSEYAQGAALKEERPYWEKIIAAGIPPLCPEKETPVQEAGTVSSASFTLTENITELLQTRVHRVYNTEINDILLTALAMAITRVLGNKQVVIDLEGHGREPIVNGVDITRTVGWFTSIYPFVLSAGDHPANFRKALVQVKESLRKVPNKGIGYGVLRYLGGGFDQELAASLVFNYLGEFGETTDEKENTLFSFSNIYKGNDISGENNTLGRKLRVSGITVNKKLAVTIAFNDAVYNSQQVNELATAYRQVLEHMIEQLAKDAGTYRTPADLTYKGLTVTELSEINIHNKVEDVYRLSPLQEGLYYHWISGTDKATYCAQHSYRLHMPEVSLQNIEKSYELLVARHSVLRTGFMVVNGELLQVVYRETEPVFVVEDVAATVPPETRELYVQDYKAKDKARGFDAGQHSLMRLSVLYLGDGNYEFIWCNHHILMDGWCGSILVNEFYQLLVAVNTGRPALLPEVVPYSSYIKWLNGVNRASGIAYWQQYLTDYAEKAVLPFKQIAEPGKGYMACEELVEIMGEHLEALKNICARYNITESVFVQSAWGYLLSKYNNTCDVVFGTVVSGRPAEIAGVENMVGLFINTIPARVNYNGDMRVAELFRAQQEASVASLPHHYISLSDIQSKSQLGKELFSHIYVFENYAVNELDEQAEQAIAATGSKGKIALVSGQSTIETHYDFDILAAPLANGMHIALRYNGHVYRQEDIRQMKNHLENVLLSFIAEPEMQLKEVSCITAEETEQLKQFNNTAIAYPENQNILTLFAEQVNTLPNQVAVVVENERLTFKELNDESGRLAQYLHNVYGVVKNDLVAIQLHRSRELPVAIMGILKAGAAYIPLDMHYPEERVRYIKEDSRFKVCIDNHFMAIFGAMPENQTAMPLPVVVSGTDAAYGIYTSGSTGQPKGVLNSHAGLYNRLLWMRNDLNITHNDILLQKTPYTFDVSVWELLMPAVAGCRLVFAKPEGHKDPEYLQQLIKSSAVTVVHFVPSMLGIFLEHLQPASCASLRHIVCSGEALPAAMVEDCKQKMPWVRIHNLYGPTEAAIDVTSIDLTSVNTTRNEVTIGKPVANTRIYIVDQNLSRQPVGVCGELLIEGVQVAQGYLNRPELNREKFIPSPFTPGERVYRTGDVAKWLPNGEIAYVGRIDNQVKIRGNRVELGEIESAIVASGYVENTAVLVKQDANGHKHLVGYMLPREQYTEDALYAFLKARLPEYMVPARLFVLNEFPLTSSGKVNRNVLAELEEDLGASSSYTAPENETQAELAEIWETILGLKGIGIHDNFFRVGGDSILAIRLISKINAKYRVNLAIAQLYEWSTIATLAQYINQRVTSYEQEQQVRAAIEKDLAGLKAEILAELERPEEIEDVYPMSDIQKGMVILSDLNQQTGVYHDQFSFQVPRVDPVLFKEAFAKLVWKHPTLRTRLSPSAYSTAVQLVKKEEDFAIDYKDLQQLSASEKIAFIRDYMERERKIPFQLDGGMLWRISLFAINEHSSVFLFQFHHAILDGWSLASMNTELFSIYRQIKQQQPVQIEKLKTTNREAVVGELYDKRNPETAAFWQNELADFRKLDIFGSEDQNLRLSQFINFESKRRLELRARHDDVTLKTVVYGAFIYALKMISYESDFVIGLLSNNRPVVEDGEKLLGCFLNTIPVRCRFDQLPQLSLSNYFKEVEKEVQRITRHNRLTLYEISRIMNERPAGGSPFFDVMFNFVNFHVYNSLELDADEEYRKSHEEQGFEDSFVLTNTTFDFTANALGNGLTLTYKLRKELKHGVDLGKIHHYVETILRSYIEDTSLVIGNLNFLTETEQQLVLGQNTAPSTFPQPSGTILDMFTAQVNKTPEAIALVFGDKRFTYRELDACTGKLAAHLQRVYGIQPNDLVGMKLPASHWSVIAILGILRSGAAYVP